MILNEMIVFIDSEKVSTDKTTIATNLAAMAMRALANRNVLLIVTDPFDLGVICETGYIR